MISRQFTETVTDSHAGLHAEARQHDQTGRGRSNNRRLSHLRGDPVTANRYVGRGVELVDIVESPSPCPAIQMRGRALTRKQKTDARPIASRTEEQSRVGVDAVCLSALQSPDRLFENGLQAHGIGRDDGGTIRTTLQPLGQSGREIDQFGPGQARGQPMGLFQFAFEPGRTVRIEEEQFRVLLRTERGSIARANRPAPTFTGRLQHDMRVDSAEAHRADRRPQRNVVRPRMTLPHDAQGRRAAGEFGVGRPAPGCGRDHLLVQRHHGLDQTGQTRGRLGVPDVGLDRSERRRRGRRIGLAPSPRKGAQLGRVADRRPGSVPLEVADGVDAEAGTRVRTLQRKKLPVHFGAREAAASVRRNPPTAQHGIDATSLRFGLVEPHQRHEAAPLARPKAG